MILLEFTIIIMFIYGVIMKRSLGLHRSQVFFIPLVLICAVITLDRFAYALKKNVISYTIYAATIDSAKKSFFCQPVLRFKFVRFRKITWAGTLVYQFPNRPHKALVFLVHLTPGRRYAHRRSCRRNYPLPPHQVAFQYSGLLKYQA